MLLARAAAADLLRKADEPGNPPIAAREAFTRALARRVIAGREGIGDAKGKPVDPDRQAIEQLLELWPAFEAIDRLYVGPALTRLDEKNV